MQFRVSRQTVTGLTVNEKVNIRSDYYRSARAMAHSLFSKGYYHRGDGVILNSAAPVEGILNHVYHVKQRIVDLHVQERNSKLEQKEWMKNKYEKPSAILKLYNHILFFKHFIDLKRPLIICEGKTDNIYLRHAIRKLAAFHPKLATINQGSISLNVQFFRYSPQAFDVLRLGGGTGDLKRLIVSYCETTVRFKGTPVQHPVIVLIDNDDGAKPIFSTIQSKFHITADFKTELPYYHLCRNLFLIKTPAKGLIGSSCIEDFLPLPVRQTELDGKKFNPERELNTATEYGKIVFAEQVVAPNVSTIDFRAS
jgi:hypothetical protein